MTDPANTMRAMASTRKTVTQVEIAKPLPKPGEVRVRVVSAAVNAGEKAVLSGSLVGRFLHARTDPLILGWDFSGTVDALGDGVSDLEPGDPVWGHLAFSMTQKQGTYAEYVTVPRKDLAIKPVGIAFDQAAAAATPAMTALQSMRDLGGLGPSRKALIIGAGGGIGAIAVGIAKRLGADVTAVCSAKDVDRVKALGADAVIDRKAVDPLSAREEYDVVFDTPAVHSFGRCHQVLRPGGTYVTTLPDLGLITGMLRAAFSSKRCKFVQVASKRADLELVGGWLANGLAVDIDSKHKVSDLGNALARQTDRARVGRVVIDVAEGW